MATRAGERNGRRVSYVIAGAVLVVLIIGWVAHRVFAPAEVVTPARGGYPAPVAASTGVVGTLNAAPLIVDDRLRVYATIRKVWADRPVDAPTRRTPYWSYRRWPAQVSGVLAAGSTVVTRWSDGKLVALDAATGRPVWRSAEADPDSGYHGRRTGASTVYAPAGLHSGTAADGRTVLVVTGPAHRSGIELATGRVLWRMNVNSGCHATGLTTTAGQFVAVDTCATPPVVEFLDVGTGAVAGQWSPAGAGLDLAVVPVGCGPAQSACPAIRTTGAGGTRGWLVDRPGTAAGPAPEPLLDAPDAVLAGGVVVAPQPDGLVARPVRGGPVRWRWPGREQVVILAAQPGRVHLRTVGNDLVTLDSATGEERSRFPLTQGRDGTGWVPGYVYPVSGFLAVERLAPPVDPAADDRRYYLAAQPVILAAT